MQDSRSSSDDTDNSAIWSGAVGADDDDSTDGSDAGDDEDSNSDDDDDSAVREGNQAVRVAVDEDSFLSFGVAGSTEEDIDPIWQLLCNKAEPIDDMQLATRTESLVVNPPNWENDPIQLGQRCNECGERPCLWLEHREEMMEIYREYYDRLPIDDQPPNIIHRIRIYNEFVRYMNRRGIGEQLRGDFPNAL